MSVLGFDCLQAGLTVTLSHAGDFVAVPRSHHTWTFDVVQRLGNPGTLSTRALADACTRNSDP